MLPFQEYSTLRQKWNKFCHLLHHDQLKDHRDNALKIAELKSGGGESNADSQSSAQSQVDSNAEGQEQEGEKKGVEIVPIAADGDPDQMRRSLTILTDQVYQLTVEKTAWENERAKLKAEIKKLKDTKEAKPKAKSKAKPEKKEDPKTKPKTEEKKEPAKKAEPKQEEAKAKPETENKTEAKPEEKPTENKTAGEPAKTQ